MTCKLHWKLRAAAAAGLLAWVGCAEDRADVPQVLTNSSAAPLRVFVVNTPLAYFAERIGGDAVEVVFPAPPGVDPAFWSPDAETIGAYQTADLILRNGAGYADWIDRATLPESRIVDTGEAFRDRLLPINGAASHRHGPKGEHTQAGGAFTTWLDPELARLQAAAVAEALAKLQPSARSTFLERLQALDADLAELDARLSRAAQSIGAEPVLFSHPVYEYLIARYELNARSLHWEPDTLPEEKAWAELTTLRAEFPARWLVWEGDPSPEMRRHLQERGVTSVVFDPAANRAPASDWFRAMNLGASALEQIAEQR
jgi:zinc transport system substrate-binding protein